jgi:PilZ domain
MTIERRKHTRFLTKDNSFAAIRNDVMKVGKINDISISGLGFSFLSECTQVDSADHHTHVDIFCSKNGFHLSKVPCRIVYDIPDASPDKGFLVRMSRCGLQFGEITRSQSEQMKLFMENYTTGTLNP